jgi:hypothetical protein
MPVYPLNREWHVRIEFAQQCAFIVRNGTSCGGQGRACSSVERIPIPVIPTTYEREVLGFD